jgi:uncharacterized membrane protein YjgN (DUF898 family)
MDQHVGATPSPPSAHLRWVHPTGLVSLSFANYVLSIVTLGIYSFWGKTEIRKRLWSAVRLEGEPLLYTGTGKELFLGFLVIFFLVLLPLMVLPTAASLLLGERTVGFVVFMLVYVTVLYFLVGVAIYRALRYRLSRTRWRGIRGALAGSPNRYALVYFSTLPLLILTLGWIAPWRTTKLQGIITNDMRFGDRPFKFTATSKPLYSRFVWLWVAAVVILAAAISLIMYLISQDLAISEGTNPAQRISPATLGWIFAAYIGGFVLFGLASAWYYAFQFNHFSRNTHFEGASLRANLTGGGLIWVIITNMLITIFTLGILAPVTQARMMRYVVQNMGFVGTPPFAEIAQSADQHITRGEGLAQAFDIDAF